LVFYFFGNLQWIFFFRWIKILLFCIEILSVGGRPVGSFVGGLWAISLSLSLSLFGVLIWSFHTSLCHHQNLLLLQHPTRMSAANCRRLWENRFTVERVYNRWWNPFPIYGKVSSPSTTIPPTTKKK
jgi:hypothetical protein